MGETGDSWDDELRPRIGGWGAHRKKALVRRKRGGPWVRWLLLLLLLNLIISLIIIIVGPGGPRTPLLACAPLHFPTKVSINSKQNPYVPGSVFCCCDVFLCFSSKDSHDFPLKRNVFSLFFIKLSLSPKDYHTFCKLTVDCVVLVAADLMYSCKNNQISQGEFSLQHHYRDDSCKCCILLPAG